jgi:hypothetical protein
MLTPVSQVAVHRCFVWAFSLVFGELQWKLSVGIGLGIECALGVGRVEYLDNGGCSGLMQLARSRSWLMMPERYAGCLHMRGESASDSLISASLLVACST